MIFRVLGCSGSESSQEHPCSFLLGDTVLLDMGSAASRLTIPEQCRVTDVFLSHGHLDHTKDLAFFAENIFSRVARPVSVRSTADTLRKVGEHLLNNELWPDFTKLPSGEAPVMAYAPLETLQPVKAGGMEVCAVPVHHPGGCVAYLFRSPKGTIVYSGDTGPTDQLWEEVNRRGEEVKAILLETSFPNRLQKVADASGHHTPATLAKEIQKIRSKNVAIYLYHLKSPSRDETLRELEVLDDSRLRLLKAGMTLEF